MSYDLILKTEGSFRKAAASVNLSKSQFVKFWKRELGLCERRTSCKSIPKPGTTLCQECSDYLTQTANKETKRRNGKLWKSRNSEYINAKNKEYYYKNHEKRRAYANNYYKTYKTEERNAKSAKRRAIKKKAAPPWVDDRNLKRVYKNCPKGKHVDHIIPLQNSDVCGLHVPWNLQYLTPFENESKSNSFDGTYENNSWRNTTCHQYLIRLKTEKEDKSAGFPFDLRASDFQLNKEEITLEIRKFIERYEWLGTLGWHVKWAFTARWNGKLAGVVLISEPTKYSKFTDPKKEALIQRGACSSWAPKNLNSRLVMFACRWMSKNTEKRLFVAYSDPKAGEIGTIYQACNFKYLGSSFGRKKSYILQNGKRVGKRYFTRTASMKKWAKESNISWDKSWTKENGYQNLSKIPEDIKTKLYEVARLHASECSMEVEPTKGKYLLILGSSKKEQKLLESELEHLKFEEYPKRMTPSVKYAS